jgi:eukaryotic-like serine/threonine-protein kinase
MIMRVVAILAAVPLLGLGALGLGGAFVPGHAAVAVGGGLLDGLLALAGAGDPAALRGLLASPVAGGGFLVLGLGALWLGLRLRRKEAEALAEDASPADRRLMRKSSRQAASLARKGHLAEAGEVAFASGLLDQAAEYFERAGELVRAAEIHHDRNRFGAAAELYVRAGQPENAGTIYAAQKDYAKAAECYFEAGRMSVAGEMYEKAGQQARAGECFARCGFHRHAAQAFVHAQSWLRAAESLDAVIVEEGTRVGSGHDPAKQRELRKLVLQAGKLYEQAGELQAAERVLERGGCPGPAAEIAVRLGHFEKAAELFRLAGDAPRAADALRQVGQESAADQLLAEHCRDQGDDEEAARLFVQAGDYSTAGDLYRKLEDYEMAGECYERQTDAAQAAEMFRLAGDHARAAANFAEVGRWEEAAECAAHLGDPEREAEYLSRAGQPLRAGQILIEHGRADEAIKTLQQVRPDAADFAAAAALLGELFRSKGQDTLAIKKLRQAAAGAELDAGNLQVFYALATAHEAAGELHEAVDLYEKILAADYGHRDVEQRLASARARARELPPGELGAGASDTGAAGRPGRYRIEDELGRGGMGIVYKAHDTVLDRTVAFKVLPHALRDNPQALKSFLREAKSAAKLNHPNIVTVYDAGEQDGRYYIAMEYVDGTTLKEIVRRRGMIPPTAVLHVMLQMCDALDFAHRQKVIHRDIKTANTMWTREKKVKIMDFGLAKVVEEVRNHTTLVSGTPYYMSPEQTLGRNIDQRTDLYSLGVTLFELATGTLPFKEGNVPYHHVHTPAPDPCSLNPKLPPLLAQIISRCLEKDPARRFQTAGEIASLVRSALAKRQDASESRSG